MKISIDVPELGKRTYNMDSPNFLVDFISDQMEYLIILYRQRKTDALSHDIGFYKYMLSQPNATELIRTYRRTQDEIKTSSKADVAKHLGWDITPWNG